MAKLNLKSMSAPELIDLRGELDEVLAAKVSKERAELEAQLQKLSGFGGKGARTGRRGHPLAGKKVAPKYRGPGGETWTGRGLKPKWLAAALKDGKKLEDFLIAAGGAGRRGRRKKKA